MIYLFQIYHLHTEKIIHRDIACRNILLDTKYNAKISDFGLARATQGGQDKGNTESTTGPIRHMAPVKIIYNKDSFTFICFYILCFLLIFLGMYGKS